MQVAVEARRIALDGFTAKRSPTRPKDVQFGEDAAVADNHAAAVVD